MAEHVLKTWAPFWDAIERGEKTFELRFDDRGFRAGDTLVLARAGRTPPHEYTDRPPRYIRRTVTYVMQGGAFGLMPGWVCMGLGAADAEDR